MAEAVEGGGEGPTATFLRGLIGKIKRLSGRSQPPCRTRWPVGRIPSERNHLGAGGGGDTTPRSNRLQPEDVDQGKVRGQSPKRSSSALDELSFERQEIEWNLRGGEVLRDY